jgi:hypothetical protein
VKNLLPFGIALSLFSIQPLCAQEQEKKLLDRIQKPDMQLGNPLQSKAFAGVSGAGVKTSSFANKTHGTTQSGAYREFSGTRSFLGIKNPWFGQRSYDAKSALLSSRLGLDTSKSYALKPAATESFSDVSKKANATKQPIPTKPFQVQGEVQGALQQISEKVKKEMTIDDVRELLNKPR